MSTQINDNGNGRRLNLGVDRIVRPDEYRFIKVSGIGRDRLGIVYKISNIITRNSGNIFLQRSMKVAGEFAITVIASFDCENLCGLQKTLQSFGQNLFGEEFVLFAREIEMSSYALQEECGTKYVVKIIGDDQRGIVESMTLILLQNNLNLTFMESEVSYRPFQGTPAFSSTFEVIIPDGFDMAAFEEELDLYQQNTDLTILIRQD